MTKWLPLLFIVIVLTAFFLLEINQYFSFTLIKTYHPQIFAFITEHPILSPLLFMTLYALTVICLLPVGGFLSIAGGFLFEEPISIFYILIGSTLGACTLFTLARGPLRTLYLNNAREQLKKIDKKFKKNSIQFLLFLRLIPFSPFWLVNLACAFFGVKFWRFAWTTFVGNIIPTLIFVQIGAQFETLIKAGQEISVHSIFNWRIILLLLTLALVPLLSIFFKKR